MYFEIDRIMRHIDFADVRTSGKLVILYHTLIILSYNIVRYCLGFRSGYVYYNYIKNNILRFYVVLFSIWHVI
jgi:hypothetical protein